MAVKMREYTEIDISATPYANQYGYTDVHPYKIVQKISDITLEVKAVRCELSKDWKPNFIVGGFAGHCTNQQEQKWDFFETIGEPIRIRLHRDGSWRSSGGMRFKLTATPHRFHDYNF